jgi:glycosyltransferase involved in cell wall biosynthesis
VPESIHKPLFSLILPCFNPPEGWQRNVVSVFKHLQSLIPGIDLRLTIVNDGSQKNITQKTTDFLEAEIPGLIFHSYPINKGKGHALRSGVNLSGADYYLYTDIDFPYRPESMAEVITLLCSDQYDIVAGIKGEGYYEQTPFLRKQVSLLLRAMTRLLLQLPVSDTQCGLKGFNEKGKALFMQTTIERYLFDLEFLWLAGKNKSLRTFFHPVLLRDNIRFSSINPLMLAGEGYSFLKIVVWKLLGFKK